MSRWIARGSRLRFWVVAAVISVIVLVCGRLTGGVSGVLQVLVPVQHALSSLISAGGSDAAGHGGDEVGRLRRRLREYEHRVASMGARITELQERNTELSGIRRRGFASGRLIHARIVASDSLPWRESRLLDEGTLAGVRPGDRVITDLFVAAGESEGVVDGMSILAGETLLGEITDASTHTARVLLLTDPASRSRLVRIGRLGSDGVTFCSADFILRGLGKGRMKISGVSHRFVERQEIEVGDIVLTSDADDRLPLQVVVGRIKAIFADDNNAVLFNLWVEPAVDLMKLKRVFVVDTLPN